MGAKRVRWAPGCASPEYYEAVAKAEEIETLSMLNMARFYLPTLKAIAEGEEIEISRRSNGQPSPLPSLKVLRKYGLVKISRKPFQTVFVSITSKGKAVYETLIQNPIPV